jgi:hypothetical protein
MYSIKTDSTDTSGSLTFTSRRRPYLFAFPYTDVVVKTVDILSVQQVLPTSLLLLDKLGVQIAAKSRSFRNIRSSIGKSKVMLAHFRQSLGWTVRPIDFKSVVRYLSLL